MRVIENRHTGIKTMFDEMKRINLPETILKNEREDFVVTFYNGEYPDLYPKEITNINKAHDKAYDRAYDKAHDGGTIKEKIILFCEEERSIYEIMEYVGHKNRTRFRRDYIKPLVELKQLKMTIPDKPTSKKQRYICSKDNIE